MLYRQDPYEESCIAILVVHVKVPKMKRAAPRRDGPGQKRMLDTGRYGSPPAWRISYREMRQLIERARRFVNRMEDNAQTRASKKFVQSMIDFAKNTTFVLTSKQLHYLCRLSGVHYSRYVFLHVSCHEELQQAIAEGKIVLQAEIEGTHHEVAFLPE